MHLQTEYQLIFEQVNRLAERRQTVTATYLSVNAAIVGAISLILTGLQVAEGRWISTAVLLVAGVIVCDLWRRLIGQYSILLGWWYERLRALEILIPDSSKLLTKEYEDLYSGDRSKRPLGMTHYEIRLTWVFTFMYASFGTVILGFLLFSRV